MASRQREDSLEQPLQTDPNEVVIVTSTKHISALAREGLLQGVLTKITNWGRRSSIWPLVFGTACCFIEMAVAATSRYDLARFGSEVMRASPRQADLMIVSGTVTKKMVPNIVRLYNQMAEPKWVISMGACATSGGPFKEGYDVVSGVDEFIPVDIYIPGCPPRPEAVIFGIMKLQEKIDGLTPANAPWTRRPPEGFTVPLLGPDLIDVRQFEEIRRWVTEPGSTDEHQSISAEPAPAGKDARPAKPAKPDFPEPRIGHISFLAPAEEGAASLREAFAAKVAGEDGLAFYLPSSGFLNAARALRNEHGYAYLSSITAVDYPPDRLEVVYHLYKDVGAGMPLILKAYLDRNQPDIDSVISVWAGADFQEREAWDLYGVRFNGHPNLRRILLWEGFAGHPMRKDWKEPYYEQETKPFDSRWPGGHYVSEEERVRWNRNVQYPKDWDLGIDEKMTDEYQVVDVEKLQRTTLNRNRVIINLGPQHPSTHGVFRMVATIEGETIVELIPVMGYLHRNHEQIGERNAWIMNMPFTDRLDYFSGMANELAYALAVEKLMGIKPPERAEYIRVIQGEFTRIANHFIAIGAYLNDIGSFFTPVLYAFNEREYILDLFEMSGGSRMMPNYMRFGGVARDLPPEYLPLAHELVHSRLPKAIDQIDEYLSGNEIMLARSKNVGTISAARAIQYSLSGPLLRSTGVAYDVRRAEPYSIYDRFDFDVITHPDGDNYARYWVRIQEMRQSLRILEQALRDIPDGDILTGRKQWLVRVPKGDAYTRIESPKGELGFYVVSDGGPNPYRYHIRAPSFVNITALPEMTRGYTVADAVAILGSIDINMGELDR